eukprot:ANDGO_04337.mRNA.1 hypothetical protein
MFPDVVYAFRTFSKLASVADKMRFSFMFYDFDGDGEVSETDIRTILTEIVAGTIPQRELDVVARECIHELSASQTTIKFEEFQTVVNVDRVFTLNTFSL